MKVALPIEGDQINQHFGRSQQFLVAEVQDGQIGAQEMIESSELQHNHQGLASLMIAYNVGTVIVGGIGQPARKSLEDNGLSVISGASGSYQEVLRSFAAGTLVDTSVSCQHDHDHPHHHH